jgi:hypothetical protein
LYAESGWRGFGIPNSPGAKQKAAATYRELPETWRNFWDLPMAFSNAIFQGHFPMAFPKAFEGGISQSDFPLRFSDGIFKAFHKVFC